MNDLDRVLKSWGAGRRYRFLWRRWWHAPAGSRRERFWLWAARNFG